MLFDIGDCLIRLFVCPNGIFRLRSADGNAVVRTVTLVRTIGVVLGSNEQRHVRVGARQDRRDGGVCRRSGIVLHYRGEPYRGWRNERLNQRALVNGPHD